jgi:hypothetical protein
MNKDETINLATDRARVEELWCTDQSTYVPLQLAASFTVHAVGLGRPPHETAVTPNAHSDALNIAAAALSAVIPIYALQHGTQDWVAVLVDPVRHRFEDGATALRRRDGRMVLNLSVKRADVVSAIPIVERAGVTFYAGLSAKTDGPTR